MNDVWLALLAVIALGCGNPPKPREATAETNPFVLLAIRCNDGDRGACVSLADTPEETRSSLSKADRRRVGMTLLNSCYRDDEIGACNTAGILLSEIDPSKAVEAYREGCNLGLGPSCTNLAYRYLMGIGVQKDVERAGKIYESTCDTDAGSCSELAAFYLHTGRKVPFERLTFLFKSSCYAGWPNGCTGIGRLYFQEVFEHVDYAEAERWLRKGCDGGDITGCHYLERACLLAEQAGDALPGCKQEPRPEERSSTDRVQ